MSEQVRDDTVHQQARLVAERAENLYLTGQLLCSEAVLTVLNRGLKGGLTDAAAISLTSALPLGIGDSGCTCGALTGAVLAVGLFLGRSAPSAGDRNRAMETANMLVRTFKERFGSLCCRALTRKVKHDSSAHFKQCAGITSDTAALAFLLIVEKRPELIGVMDQDYLKRRDSWLGSTLRRVIGGW